jgi:uncharacterized oxidoreductase
VKFENRVVLITGGTSGIGLELTKQLLQRGNTVIITGRDQGRLDAMKRDFPRIHAFKSDISDPAAIAALRDRVLQQFPELDTLINNAGIMRKLSFGQDEPLQDVTREIEINLSGPVRMIQEFLPHLKSRPASLIVNVSSGLAFIPLPAAAVYCATKAALHSFTQSLRIQLRGTNVTVIELAPPAVQTPLIDREWSDEMAGQKLMDPAILAKFAIAGIEAGRIEIRPGLSNVLKAMSRIAPQFMLRQMAKATQRAETGRTANPATREASAANSHRPSVL